jgi:hypothetical protein
MTLDVLLFAHAPLNVRFTADERQHYSVIDVTGIGERAVYNFGIHHSSGVADEAHETDIPGNDLNAPNELRFSSLDPCL